MTVLEKPLANSLNAIVLYFGMTQNKNYVPDVETIGKKLHLIETMRLIMDGGVSLNAIQERVSDSAKELAEIADKI